MTERTKNLPGKSIVVFNDNGRVIRRCKKTNKATEAAADGRAAISKIKRLIKQSKVKIILEVAEGKPKIKLTFEINLGSYLVGECH